MVAFAQSKFQIALDNFSRAIVSHPHCSATVRTAVATCCYKLQQYDRARLAVQGAAANDVSYCILCNNMLSGSMAARSIV